MTSVVVGAGGGIGCALVEAMHEDGPDAPIIALSRDPGDWPAPVIAGRIDVTVEASIAAAAGRIDGPVTRLIVATGILHEDGRMPERALRELDGPALARIFQVNTIGPALVLKHFAPRLAREGRVVVACLSARVGSVSDNRAGGWYGYRASKAALNMIVRSAAIELARRNGETVCVALHPGTVDTGLSKPFQRGVPAEKLFPPARAARQLLDVLDGLTPAESGRIFAWDGAEIAP